jgi:single-strand DNA-binding protein
MASLNKVLLIGNLTKDPEIRYTPSGTPVANLRMAVNRTYKTKAGENKDETCFLTAVVWSKQAEICGQYLRKGSPLFVEGRLQSRSWDDAATGQKRSVMEVLAERIQFMGQPGQGQRERPQEPARDTTTEQEWLEQTDESPDESMS